MPRQSYQIIDTPPELTPRRSKKLLGRQQSPTKSRIPSAKSTPLLNDDRSEKLVRTTNKRNALNELNRNILTATPHRSHDGHVADGSANTTPKTPDLSNFEEWMKLATDNKINATNSWNFALIDYFHDMSLLKEGDGINFQKASCTLDGCVKIYSSRIDSVATETGKLLSGLTENNTKSRKNISEEDDDESADSDNEPLESSSKKSRRRVRSEATLAKDFSAIQQKKLDLEFSVDPLFKKASADFDEGGAKGLLLNHLSIDNTGRVVFDTSEDAVNSLESEEIVNGPTKELDLDALRDRYFGDILHEFENKFISPSLKDFEFPADPDAVPLDIPFIRSFEDDTTEDNIGQDGSLIEERFYDNNDGYEPDYDAPDLPSNVKEEFGNGGDVWLSNIRSRSEAPEFDDGIAIDNEGGEDDNDNERNLGSYVLQFAEVKHGDDENEIMAYFNENAKNTLNGLQHWKILKAKKDAQGAQKSIQPRQSRKKEELVIDFFNDDEEIDEEELFEQGNPSSMVLPRAQWRSETRNLLEEEVNFASKSLLRLFLKPRVQLRFLKPGEKRAHNGTSVMVEPSHQNSEAHEDTYFPDDRNLDDEDDVRRTYDADFFNDDGFNGPAEDGNSFVDASENLEFSTEAAFVESGNDATLTNAGNLTTVIRHEEAQEEFEFGSQLVFDNSRKFKTDYVNYAKVAKKVDVKKLKDNLWSSLDYDQPSVLDKPNSERRSVTQEDSNQKYFSEIVGSLKEIYPAKAMADISTSFCFICLLHLANEKGLAIQNNGDYTDLAIRKDFTAVIDEY